MKTTLELYPEIFTSMTYKEALQKIEEVAGERWRLPTHSELIDIFKATSPTVDDGWQSGYFWAEAHPNDSQVACKVFCWSGDWYWDRKSNKNAARFVRSI